MKVSIIIPVYNAEDTIRNTIQSCLNQSYNNIEIVVINDGSSDSTESIIDSMNEDRIVYLKTGNRGRSVARNLGLDKASGELVQFLDADDVLKCDKIQKAVSVFMKDYTIDAVHCGTVYFENGKIINRIKANKQKNHTKILLRKNIFTINSLIFRKEISSEFRINMKYNEDWEYWIYTLQNAKIFYQTDYLGAFVYIHDKNTMKNKEQMYISELELIVKLKKEFKIFSLKRDLRLIKRFIVLNITLKHNLNSLIDDNPLISRGILKLFTFILQSEIFRSLILNIIKLKNNVYNRKNIY
ncbi:glycosyltransferase family 2 protein [Gracilibacillus kekensis]|uniref:Glycosyltransferase involved in cell wall bisynthesis n=1 Tax=Gracilibacillus kekensis TaxID=1027249 RepID=A0A1M7K281_9BACI|nr:glycosyltransferase [Gracilibacillus kekensis]SHM59314.1 Glycosyltransferase involved in cell wall bisynthesis [Gracilibacillus kekensis]